MTLEVTTELKLNRITEEIAGWGNVDTAAIWATLAMQPEELNKGKLADINEKRDCNKKDEDVPEEVTLAKKLPVKENLWGTSWPWKFKEQNVGSWSQLRKDMTTCQGIENMLALYWKLQHEKEEESTVTFFTKNIFKFNF